MGGIQILCETQDISNTYWGSKINHERISIYLLYKCKSKKENLSKLYISILYFTEDSEYSDLMKRYKERYPKEDWGKNIKEVEYDKIWGEGDL
jgi:hypothetical protein